jgi:Peptidase family M28
MDLVEALAAGIGPRIAGSDESSRAADTVADGFRELGLEPRFQEFQFLGYDAEEPQLEIAGERWTAGPCLYAHPTACGGVEGTVRRIGKHLVVPGLFEPEAFAIEDADGTEVGRLYANPMGGGAVPFGSGYGYILSGPAAFISTADGERLADLDGAQAHLQVEGEFVPGRHDRNVIAELPGESDEAVVVCAHFDSVWHGPGTVDNATGVEGVRRVLERLSGRTLPRTVIFAAFAAEEIGCIGSRYSVVEAKTRGELERVVGVVNLDCIAHGDQLQLWASPDELRGRGTEIAASLGLDQR